MGERTGLKTQFQRKEGAEWVSVAMVATISPPQQERDVVEVEELNPPDEVKKKLPGLIDVGEVGLTLNFDVEDANHQQLQDDFDTGATIDYRILLANNWAWTCKGFISGFAPSEISAGDVMQAEVTITLQAKPTLAAVVA